VSDLPGVCVRQDGADDDRQGDQRGERAGGKRNGAIKASHPLKPTEHAQHECWP